MNKLTKTLLLALALLLSQTAVALHDIHCLDEAHAQSCQVCSAHDHSAYNIVGQHKIESNSYEEKPSVISPSVLSIHYYSFYLSRAPPK